ncbi:MAG: hypothetical protein ACI8QC_002550 [Planctomycetota bacterium]|jgi:hypothetical protein
MQVLKGDLPKHANSLSTDSLDGGHAILRLAHLRGLRESLDSKTERFDEVRQQLKAKARSAQEEAMQAIDTLHKRDTSQALEYLSSSRKELLERADQGIGIELTAALAALRVDLENVLPAERVAAIDPAILELVTSFRSGLITDAGLSEDKLQRPMAQGLERAGHAFQERIEQRVRRPWQFVTRGLPRQAERLGGQHDERVAWVVETLAGIREEVRERIDCVIQRASDDFDKQLRKRLRNLDVPAPGKSAAALEDLTQQLGAWTERFVRGSSGAISTYEDRLSMRHKVLVPTLRNELEHSEVAGPNLAVALKAVLAGQAQRKLNFDETWRTKERVL